MLGDANAVMMLMAHQVSAQYFSCQAESDADMKGAALLQKSKIDTQGMVAFSKKYSQSIKINQKNTHPTNKAQINLHGYHPILAPPTES
ncbi:MAG: hypothetical protein O2966_04350 [Proteobacteria bacterium]|nr:hypothetical protein [Pseudomonadota bacterium]